MSRIGKCGLCHEVELRGASGGRAANYHAFTSAPDWARSSDFLRNAKTMLVCDSCLPEYLGGMPDGRTTRRQPRIRAMWTDTALAHYDSLSGEIVPHPLLAISMDYLPQKFRGDREIIAVVTLSHEYVHFLLDRLVGNLASTQFDNIAESVDEWIEDGMEEYLFEEMRRELRNDYAVFTVRDKDSGDEVVAVFWTREGMGRKADNVRKVFGFAHFELRLRSGSGLWDVEEEKLSPEELC